MRRAVACVLSRHVRSPPIVLCPESRQPQHSRPLVPTTPLPGSNYRRSNLESAAAYLIRRRNIYKLRKEKEGGAVRPYHRDAQRRETAEEARQRRKENDVDRKRYQRAAMNPEEKASHNAAEAERKRRGRAAKVKT